MSEHKPLVDKVIDSKLLVVLQRLSLIIITPMIASLVGMVWWIGSSLVDHETRIERLEEARVSSAAVLDHRLERLDDRTIIIMQSIARLEAKQTLIQKEAPPFRPTGLP